ncbi:alkaline phosphatase [Synchytrium microbalum]|uniref:alkaline phosphatase n=1 Tax=Synchytrium microbalum TaxID=1806994 RepID=A0A507BWQ2_9FUNG|nr:alkaline phosphatase [Synchytrium microbalum]TPX31309.1 alkaline phosphatase [Synchytrium microbalum]
MRWITAILALVGLACAQHGVPGQFNRNRAQVCSPNGMNISITPVDGAELLVGQYFDVSIELHNPGGAPIAFSDAGATTIGINNILGVDSTTAISDSWNFTYYADGVAKYYGKSTTVGVNRQAFRNVVLNKPGTYSWTISANGIGYTGSWIVRSYTDRKAKNVLLFIGDGMAPSMISAARTVARKNNFGKYGKNVLAMESLAAIGKIGPNGLDSMITDSANSASAYACGQKGWVNGLNVYADTSAATLDDPKTETITSMIRRLRPKMCIGIVTTSEVQDATPAAFYSHTRRRADKNYITDQMINGWNGTIQGFNFPWSGKPVKADVFMGGGGEFFCQKTNSTPGCASLNNKDYYATFAASGYTVLNSAAALAAYNGSGPIAGIFTKNHMETWLDRNVYPANLALTSNSPDGSATSTPSQPNFDTMVMTAISVMDKKCTDGWFMMAEAASIDKMMHPMDFDRGLSDLLELDRTIAQVVAYDKAGSTAMMVTADHPQGYDSWGTVDTTLFNSADITDGGNSTYFIQKRRAIGDYDTAGWPNLVVDANGLPSQWQQPYVLAHGKVDGPQHSENYQVVLVPDNTTNPLSRNPAIVDTNLTAIWGETIANANPNDPAAAGGLPFNANLPVAEVTTVHTYQNVDLYCHGPSSWVESCSAVNDNTEVFFMIANALGLNGDGTLPTSF